MRATDSETKIGHAASGARFVQALDLRVALRGPPQVAPLDNRAHTTVAERVARINSPATELEPVPRRVHHRAIVPRPTAGWAAPALAPRPRRRACIAAAPRGVHACMHVYYMC